VAWIEAFDKVPLRAVLEAMRGLEFDDSEEPAAGRAKHGSGVARVPPRLQQPRQIDVIILSTFASSRSMAGLVPSSGPFWGPLPTPFDESAVPNELVPGAAGLVPKAPPVTGMPPAPEE
jgi:hypothetical protein